MAELNEIAVFVKVVQTGGFTSAAKELDLPKSTVSRKLAQLEERLGARLLQRTTRTLALTEVGSVYYEHCARIVAEIEDAERAVMQLQDVPRGLLRISAPLRFRVLGDAIPEFLARYPGVRVEVVCTDRVVDLVEEGFDLAIRAGNLDDGSLIAARLLDNLPRMLVAAPSRFADRPAPRAPQELEREACLVFRGGRERAIWRLRKGARTVEVPVQGPVIANDFEILVGAAVAGLGVALLPVGACGRELRAGRLVRLLEDWTSVEVPLHAVYPSTRHLSPKVRAFIDFLRERITPDAFTPAP